MKMLSYKQAIIQLMSELHNSTSRETEMYAVVQTAPKYPFELRTIMVDRKTGSLRRFDTGLIEDGFRPYTADEAEYKAFEEALDLKGAVGVLQLPVSGENEDDALPLQQLVELANDADRMYLDGKLEELASDEFQKVKGMLFRFDAPNNGSIYAFQRILPSAVMKESGFLYRASGGASYAFMTDEVIKLDHTFDFLILDNAMLVLKTETVIIQFGYSDELKRRAANVVKSLSDFVTSTELLEKRVYDGKMRSVRKLLKIEALPVMQMTVKQLRRTLDSTPEYKGKFRFKGNRIEINDNDDVDDLLRMLNDELLVSNLTKTLYQSEIKSIVR